MKRHFLVLIGSLLICACAKKKSIESPYIPKTTAEKIAYAHGYEHWKNVSELKFTFNIDKDTLHYERKWLWNPMTNDVTMLGKKDTIVYNSSNLDSISLQADRRFINDKYWLLLPFQLIWDTSATISEPTIKVSPIRKDSMQSITLTYPSEGGYTPGDAYDIFYNKDYIIQEWIFREANSNDPSLITTFENYQDISGLKLAIDHKKMTGDWNLNFTNISVIRQNEN